MYGENAFYVSWENIEARDEDEACQSVNHVQMSVIVDNGNVAST